MTLVNCMQESSLNSPRARRTRRTKWAHWDLRVIETERALQGSSSVTAHAALTVYFAVKGQFRGLPWVKHSTEGNEIPEATAGAWQTS